MTDEPKQKMLAAHPLASVPAALSREEKKARDETIRAEKARATQEARVSKQNMALCQGFLHRSTKVHYMLVRGLPSKFLKNLKKSTRKKIAATTKTLTGIQKQLTMSLRSGGKSQIDKTEVEQAVTKGEAFCSKLVGQSQMI